MSRKSACLRIAFICGGLLAAAPLQWALADDATSATSLANAIDQVLPAEVLAASGLSAEEIAAQLIQLANIGWQPAESAPRDREVLLGHRTAEGFRYGVGYWEVADDLHAGRWTVEEWWGESPTHWFPVPPVPAR